ncbi:MAG: glycerophosphodiester phosphodiesterase [Anaerolineae bacterium]
MHIIAHRGASAYEPENTVRAFERALELGADWLELDVRLTVDGHAVVSHADELESCTNGRGRISTSTLAYVRGLDAGAGERVPTFAEVMEALAQRCGLYVELKADGAATAVAASIDPARRDGLVLGSFRPRLLLEAAAAAPGLPRSILVGDPDVDLVEAARAVGAHFVHPCWEAAHPTAHVLLTEALLARWAAAGLETVVWHEERPEELAHLARLPVWGICTNAPDVLSQVLG